MFRIQLFKNLTCSVCNKQSIVNMLYLSFLIGASKQLHIGSCKIWEHWTENTFIFPFKRAFNVKNFGTDQKNKTQQYKHLI